MRWLFNLFSFLVALFVFAAALFFVIGNSEPVTLALFWFDWRPSVPLGQLLVGFLLAGLLFGFAAGLTFAGFRRLSRREHKP